MEIAQTNKQPEDYLTGKIPDEFKLYLTSPSEIINVTKKLKSKHSSDPYGLSSFFIKIIRNIIN